MVFMIILEIQLWSDSRHNKSLDETGFTRGFSDALKG